MAEQTYVPEPATLDEAAGNVAVQLANVDGWVSVKDYECAFIKAQCLVKDLEQLLKIKYKLENVDDIWLKSLWLQSKDQWLQSKDQAL